MSTLKIVGIESELRLDNLKNETGRPDYFLDDVYLPDLFVNHLLRSVHSVPAFNRDIFYQKTLKEITEDQHKVKDIIEAHIKRDRNLRPHRDKNIPELQVYAYSGGYTSSGFRIYVDGTHPEICTPECSSPKDLVCWEKAGELMLKNGLRILSNQTEHEAILYKNNSDGFGNSWGSHENYLVDENLFNCLIKVPRHNKITPTQRAWITFLISRLIYTGAGKLGYDLTNTQAYGINDWKSRNFLLSQRAEFIIGTVNNHTMQDRPWINIRNISYVGSDYGRRLHVIVGDANLCEIALYLRTGMSMIVLMMLEDELSKDPQVQSWPKLKHIFDSKRIINQNIDLNEKFNVEINGQMKKLTAIEIQRIILDRAWSWYYQECQNQHSAKNVGWIIDVLRKLDQILILLVRGPNEDLFGQIDWITKLLYFEKALSKSQKRWNQSVNYLKNLDLAYHRLDKEGIFSRINAAGKALLLTDTDSINKAIFNPPNDTRAHTRGHLIESRRDSIAICNWQRVSLTDGTQIILDSPWRND